MQVQHYVPDRRVVHRQPELDTVLHRKDISKIEPFEFLDHHQWNLSIHQDRLELIEGIEFRSIDVLYDRASGLRRLWTAVR